MWFRSLFDSLESRRSLTPAQGQFPKSVRPRSAGYRPQLEALKDRSLPSAYVLTDLGSLSGAADGQSEAYDVNASGQVVGLAYSDASSQDSRAFLWTNGAMIDLGTLGGLSSAAWAINDLGQVVGQANLVGGDYTADRVVHAFLITPEDTNGDGSPDRWFRDLDGNGANDLMTDLGLQPGAIGSSAWDINRAGQVVGSADYGGRSSAVLWTAGGMTDLGTLGGNYSTAYGINDAGQVVGSAEDAMGRQRAFLWDGSRGMTDLGTAGSYTKAWATAINTSGSVVGALEDGEFQRSAFAWKPDGPNSTTGTMTDLGWGPYSGSADINDAGQIVGEGSIYVPAYCDPDYDGNCGGGGHYEPRAVLSENGRSTDLNYLISGYPFTTLEAANAINAAGQIVGKAVDETGFPLAYLLTPVGPMISVSDVSVLEGNSGTRSAIFTVTLSRAYAQPVTVTCATADGTAIAGSDYQAASGTLTIPAGQTSVTTTVLVNGERLGEANETFSVNLSQATNATIADGQGVGTITDDEPRINIGDVIRAEGKKGQTTLFTFTVTLSAAYDQAVTMSYRTANGTATTGDSDYIAKNGTLTFAPGETTKTITIEVKGDSKREANETFNLDLFGLSSNGLFTKSRGVGTILNDD